jgi:hypothetical protein
VPKEGDLEFLDGWIAGKSFLACGDLAKHIAQHHRGSR